MPIIRIGFNRNSNFEFDKNIFTWAVTTAIPDLGGKGNLAGIIIGQEPRVTAASDLDVIDTGNAVHIEGFYKIEIDKDFSITPAIVYQTGPNIDNIAAGAGSITGAIGINYKF
jgi:Carbohydrate-selective porin, OprB family